MSSSNPKAKSVFAPRGARGRQLEQQREDVACVVRLSAKGLAGITVDRHACSDIETENAQAPPPPNEVRATIAISNGSDLLGTIPCSGRLRPAPTETVVLRTEGEDIDTQSVASEGDHDSGGPRRYIALWYEQQPATASFETTLVRSNDGTTLPTKLEVLVALKHDSDAMDTLPVGVALLFISTEEMKEGKIVMDLPIHAIYPQQRASLPGFGVFLRGSDEKKVEDIPELGSVYKMDPTGDAVLRLEVEVAAKEHDPDGTRINLAEPTNVLSTHQVDGFAAKSPVHREASGIEIEETASDFDWRNVEVLSDTPSANNPIVVETSIELPITNIQPGEKIEVQARIAAENRETLREAIIKKAQKRSILKSSMPPRPSSESRSLKMTPRRPTVRLAKNVVVTPKRSVSPHVRTKLVEKDDQQLVETMFPVLVDKNSVARPNLPDTGSQNVNAVEVAVIDDFPTTDSNRNGTKPPPSNATEPDNASSTAKKAPLMLNKTKSFPRMLLRPKPRRSATATTAPAVVLEQAQAFPNPNLPDDREKTPPRKTKNKIAASTVFSFEFDNEDSSTVLTDDRSLMTKEVNARKDSGNPVRSLLKLMKIMPSCGDLRDIVVGVVNEDEDTLFDFSDAGDSITHMTASELMAKSTDDISVTWRPEDALFGFNLCRAPDQDDLDDLVSDLRGDAYVRNQQRWMKEKELMSIDEDSTSYADEMTSRGSSLGSMEHVLPKNADNETWDGSTLPTLENTLQKVAQDDEESIDATTNDVESSAVVAEDESCTVSSVDKGGDVSTATTRELRNMGEDQGDKQQTLADATNSSRSFGQVQYFQAVEDPPVIERVAYSEDLEVFDAESQQRKNRVRTVLTGTSNKSPKSLVEFPSAAPTVPSVAANQSKNGLSNSIMDMVRCGAGTLPLAALPAVPNRKTTKQINDVPKILDPEEEDSVGELTLTSNEMRIDLERYKERLQAARQRAQERLKETQGFFGFGAAELERGNSLSTAKKEDYFREYESLKLKESQIDDAAQAARAKQEFYTSSGRRTRREPRQKHLV